MTLANQELCQDNEEMMFVTVFLAQLDLTTGELIYVNGGHNPPLVSHDGRYSYIREERRQPALGALEEAAYEAHRLWLAPGEKLFLYTDGVTEAMDTQKRFYSEERLQQTLDRIDREADVQEILTAVRHDIAVHAEGAEQSDDITMLGLMYCGK